MINHCLIVEDHIQARNWLCEACKKAFPDAHLTTAGSVKEGKRLIDERVPDLALIDLGLPDGKGTTLIQLISNQRRLLNSTATIIVSTVMNDDESIFSAIRAGADGYILKEETLDGLVTMLKGIADNKPPLSASIALRLLHYFQSDEAEAGSLAPREKQILQLLAKGFTVPKVAEMLGITYNTTSSYVRDIYRKLNVNSRAEATLEASKRGLV